MGHPTDPLMRVANSGLEARGKHYSDTPATAGLVLTSAGPEAIPVWAVGSPDILVNKVIFVDAARSAIGMTGALNHPFQTIQQAVTYAEGTGWADAIIMVAPGTYAGAITLSGVPPLQTLMIQGWQLNGPTQMPAVWTRITGTITSHPSVELFLSDLHYTGATLQSPNPANDDLTLRMTNVLASTTMLGNSINLSLIQTYVLGAITGTSVVLYSDGMSWTNLIENAVVITPATYTRTFYDTGADVTAGNLTTIDLDPGDKVTLGINYPGARPNEYGICSPDLDVPGPQRIDYTVTFAYSAIDTLFFHLRNDGAAIASFDIPCMFLCLHSKMAEVVQPP